MSKYLVTVTQVTTNKYEAVEVDADTKDEAESIARDMAENGDMDPDNSDETYSFDTETILEG